MKSQKCRDSEPHGGLPRTIATFENGYLKK